MVGRRQDGPPTNKSTSDKITIVGIALMILVIIAGIIYLIVNTFIMFKSDAFTNKSEHGFYYETDSRRFTTPSDRQLAVDTIINLCKKDGDMYTRAQVANLTDSFLLLVLDPESDEEKISLRAQMAMLIDPTYPATHVAVIRAHTKNNDKLASEAERQLVYNLLVNYFMRVKNPTGVPIDRWTDALLIRTFLTRQLPKYTEFGM